MSSATIIRACDVLNQANSADLPQLVDAEIVAVCETCGPVQLSAAMVIGGAETVYKCGSCDSVLMIIGAINPDGLPLPGRGYRLGDFVLRNAVDLHVRSVLMSASAQALATERS